MRFDLLPTIDMMIGLYRQPRTAARFNDYIEKLEGDTKNDLAMPITGFNPMAKDHVAKKLEELKALDAEQIAKDVLIRLNEQLADHPNKSIFKLSLNVSDDVAGGWTNRYTSDYDSKFKIGALVKRRFSTAILWAGENYSKELIEQRTLQSAYRSIYWLDQPRPATLREHIDQEAFVARHTGIKSSLNRAEFEILDTFYKEHHGTDNYSIIFNFLYGDEAAASLNFPVYGVKGALAGFQYAAYIV